MKKNKQLPKRKLSNYINVFGDGKLIIEEYEDINATQIKKWETGMLWLAGLVGFGIGIIAETIVLLFLGGIKW